MSPTGNVYNIPGTLIPANPTNIIDDGTYRGDGSIFDKYGPGVLREKHPDFDEWQRTHEYAEWAKRQGIVTLQDKGAVLDEDDDTLEESRTQAPDPTATKREAESYRVLTSQLMEAYGRTLHGSTAKKAEAKQFIQSVADTEKLRELPRPGIVNRLRKYGYWGT